MTGNQAAALRRQYRRMFADTAGDTVTHVTASGTTTDIPAWIWDAEGSLPGVEIDSAGPHNEGHSLVMFHREILAESGVVLVPTDHYLLDGERWDLAKGKAIREKLVPIGGIHALALVVLRPAVERNTGSDGTDFSWQP